MDGREGRRRRNGFRPAILGVAGVALVHLLAKNVAAALLSVSLCGLPSGGTNLVDQFLLDRLEGQGRTETMKVRGIPEPASNFTLQ